MAGDIKDRIRAARATTREGVLEGDYAHLAMDPKEVFHWRIKLTEDPTRNRTMCRRAIGDSWLIQGGPFGPISGAFVGYPRMAELCIECMDRMARAAHEVAERLG